MHNFSLTFSKVYFTFEKKLKHCTKLICFFIKSNKLNQTSNLNTKRVYYRNARHQFCNNSPLSCLGAFFYIWEKKIKMPQKEDIFSHKIQQLI